jgi:hypothetical protein
MSLGAARVIYTLNDLSMYADVISKGYIFALAQTERGIPWDPTPIASWEEYERLFGKLISDSQDPLVLKMGLMQGAKFLVSRCLHMVDSTDKTTIDACTATVTIQDRGATDLAAEVRSGLGPFVFRAPSGGVHTGTEVGPYTIVVTTGDKMLFGLADEADQPVTLTAGTMITAQTIVDQINNGTTGITASVLNNRIHLVADNPAESLKIKTVTGQAYAPLGLTVGTYAIDPGTDSLIISINGDGNQTFTMTAGTRTAAQVVTDLSALTDATATSNSGYLYLTSTDVGSSASIEVKTASTALDVLGFDDDEHLGFTGSPQETISFESKDPGTWGNDLKIEVYASDLNPATKFDIRVAYDRQPALNEYWSEMSMDPDAERYAPRYINERSRLVVATDEESTNPNPANLPIPSEVGYALGDGSDGTLLLEEYDWIGDPLEQTGMYSCGKTDMGIDFIIPGTSNITVLQYLAAMCENTGDWVSYANTPFGYTPMRAKAWRMGESPFSWEPFNSHRLSLWFGRPLVYDSSDDTRKEISNLGHLSSCITKTTESYTDSHAPVGPRRGVVDFVEGIDWNLNDYRGFQDMFADYQINYLQITRQEGAVFWEQRTTQLLASALQHVNVIRFLTVMKRMLVPILRTFLFEPNHPMTWREVHRTLDPVFRLWKAKYEIYDYVLQTDRDAFFDGGELKNAVLNSGLEIDQGIYRARALVQPTRAIYYFDFEVGVLRTGEAFSQYTPLKELPGWVKR